MNVVQIQGQQCSVYTSYQIQGRKNTNTQQSRVMSQVIIQAIFWEIELYNGQSNIKNGEQIQMEGMYKINEMTQIQEIFTLIQVQIILQQYSKEEIKSEQYQIQMTNQIGQQNQQESHDLIITVTAWEQQNQSQYQQVCMSQYMKTQSQSAGQKYFQQSAQTTGFQQMGVSQIYSNTSTTNLDIQWAIQSQMDEQTISQKIGQQLQSIPQLFKLAAAPLHNWAPDLYDAIPTPIVQWIALIPKQGIFALQQNLAPLLQGFNDEMTSFYQAIAIISVIIGSIALGSQWKIKRFLAYSAISHVGFLQIAYITISPVAYLNYLIIYMLTSQQFFIILQSQNTSIDQQTSPSLKEQSGLFQKNPSQAIALSISQFSLAGIPPLAGFFAKQFVLEAILAESKIYIAQIQIQTSAISTANYLSVVKMSLLDLPIYPTSQAIIPMQAYLISGLSSQIQFYFMKPSLYLILIFS